MTLDFGEVITSAWRIIWKHKVLWIFGILAGCGRGGGGGGGSSAWQESGPFGSGGTFGTGDFAAGIGDWIGSHGWVIVLGILVLLILWALFVFLGTIGRIGIIRGTNLADGGADRLVFGEIFRESTPFFWRVFLLSFLVSLAFIVIIVPGAVVGVLTGGVGFLCLLPLICLLVPAMWFANIVIQQANAAMVIEHLSLKDGVRRGWSVVKKNIGSVLLIWLITAIIGFVVGILIALPMIIVVVPAIFGFATSGSDFPTAAVIASGLCFVVYLPVLLVANGILTAYLDSLWALTFLRLTQGMGAREALPVNA